MCVLQSWVQFFPHIFFENFSFFKWSSQLKQQLEAAAKAKEAGYAVPNVIDRSARNFHRFVRTVDSPKWHSMNTDQAAQIIAVLRTKDSQGKLPEVCTPNS